MRKGIKNKIWFQYVGSLMMLAVTPLTLTADIKVNLPLGSDLRELSVIHYPISKLSTANSRAELGEVYETVPVEKNIALITTPNDDSYIYIFGVDGVFSDKAFVTPGDNVLFEIASLSPYYSVASGSVIMDDITALQQKVTDLVGEVQNSMPDTQMSPETIESLQSDLNKVFVDYIQQNPASPLVPYVVSTLDDKDFENFFTEMSDEAKASPLYPLAEVRHKSMNERKAKDEMQSEMQSGHMTAPLFSLPNTYGKEVSLADFRGKWVVLDFWGSWCIWCIKGFPELKEAYQKYNGKLEIIGIDCQESKEDWLAGIERYELPWVNLYCPNGNPVLKEYGVQGFPTKAIIDPEGKLRDVTVGHNPEFFLKLESLLAE